MRKSMSSTRSRLLRSGLAVGAATALVLAAAAPAFAAVTLTLSATTGPSGGLNTITATAPSAVFTSAFTPAVSFQYGAACAANYVAGTAIVVSAANPPVQSAGILVVAGAGVKKLSTTKISITVPSSVVLTANTATPPITQTSAKYNVCVYNGTTVGATGSTLVGSATYTIAAKATLTTVSPATGPALGGTTITVVGTNFPATGMTATMGGAALTNIVVNAAGTSFTATTPAHVAATGQTLSVTTSGGTVNKSTAFDFTNGITVSPNTAPSNTSVDVDIQGVGFSNLAFTPAAASTTIDAHVYLVDGAYNPAHDTTTITNKKLGPTAECGSILPISDTELVCTFDLTGSIDITGTAATGVRVPVGTYTVTVVNNGLIDVTDSTVTANYSATYTQSIISSGSTFTVSDY